MSTVQKSAMKNFTCFGKKLKHLCSGSFSQLSHFCKTTIFPIFAFFKFIIHRLNSLALHLLYFISISFLGFFILKGLKPRNNINPGNLDLIFTSVSATTVSSMSTVEMEVFSNTQFIILIILMFLGGEVFLSMVTLYLTKSKILKPWRNDNRVNSSCESLELPPPNLANEIETGDVIVRHDSHTSNHIISLENRYLKYKSTKLLGSIILFYLLFSHILGISLVSIYMVVIPSVKDVLQEKGISLIIYPIFTIVSTFSNCGFLPTNESMVLFSKNSGLLWMLIPQVLIGNTLYPSCLRALIWFVGKFYKKEEANYLLKNSKKFGYFHLLPSKHSSFLVGTVFGFILIQFVLFSSMEWNSIALSGLNFYQKIVGVLFQCVNARFTGETIVDLATIAPAMLVLFVTMMYLPPYTSFLPVTDDDSSQEGDSRQRKMIHNMIFSQLSYLVIFIILICITERQKLKEDPVNFSILNITFEVIRYSLFLLSMDTLHI
ncbi:hypothetical protein Leryth_001022 [Lithospermum erythrorhizon]|nr:hypothetical protein Leryth_001022 [Lithospermum erythrorhizon]